MADASLGGTSTYERQGLDGSREPEAAKIDVIALLSGGPADATLKPGAPSTPAEELLARMQTATGRAKIEYIDLAGGSNATASDAHASVSLNGSEVGRKEAGNGREIEGRSRIARGIGAIGAVLYLIATVTSALSDTYKPQKEDQYIGP